MLNEINFGYEGADNQENLLPNHRRYIITLSVNDCDPFITDYQCNKNTYPTIEDVMYCIVNNSLAYENSKDEFDFMYMLGYTDPIKARDAYKACKNAYMWFESEWTDNQFCELYSEIIER